MLHLELPQWPTLFCIARVARCNFLESGTSTFDKQRAILETCDFWDSWSEWWGNMTWPTIWQFLTIFKMLTILTIFKKITIDNWQLLTILTTKIQKQQTKTILGLVTFETLITILTIGNLNSWQSLLPTV